MKHLKKINYFFLISVSIISILTYLIINTGIHGDELLEINKTKNINNLADFLYYTKQLITIPTSHIFYYWAYPLIGKNNLILYDCLKIFFHSVSIFFIYKFATDYIPKKNALFASIFFILYPTHDTSIFCYMFSLYTFVPALIMYCHHLIKHEKNLLGFSILLLTSFSHYLTPPYILGLSIIFLFEKAYKKFFLFISTFFIYLTYYLCILFYFPSYEKRLDEAISIISFSKNFTIQILSSLDTFFGLSFLIKIYLSIKSIDIFSLFICLIILIFLFTISENKKIKTPWILLCSFLAVYISSLLIFSLTGLYAHNTFNLGNRVTIYGSLLLGFILSILPFNKKNITLFFIIFILPLFGLSAHWKSWNQNQLNIISNIANNKELKEITSNEILLIKNNNYSKIGPYSHIEFFSMPWNVDVIFNESVKTKKIISLSSNVYIEDKYLVDKKFGSKFLIGDFLFIYESTNNKLTKINKKELQFLVKNYPKEKRHWVQFLDFSVFKKIINMLNPRLGYLFDE